MEFKGCIYDLQSCHCGYVTDKKKSGKNCFQRLSAVAETMLGLPHAWDSYSPWSKREKDPGVVKLYVFQKPRFSRVLLSVTSIKLYALRSLPCSFLPRLSTSHSARILQEDRLQKLEGTFYSSR